MSYFKLQSWDKTFLQVAMFNWINNFRKRGRKKPQKITGYFESRQNGGDESRNINEFKYHKTSWRSAMADKQS